MKKELAAYEMTPDAFYAAYTAERANHAGDPLWGPIAPPPVPLGNWINDVADAIARLAAVLGHPIIVKP